MASRAVAFLGFHPGAARIQGVQQLRVYLIWLPIRQSEVLQSDEEFPLVLTDQFSAPAGEKVEFTERWGRAENVKAFLWGDGHGAESFHQLPRQDQRRRWNVLQRYMSQLGRFPEGQHRLSGRSGISVIAEVEALQEGKGGPESGEGEGKSACATKPRINHLLHLSRRIPFWMGPCVEGGPQGRNGESQSSPSSTNPEEKIPIGKAELSIATNSRSVVEEYLGRNFQREGQDWEDESIEFGSDSGFPLL
ncbi:hypothetical protein C8R44DRAFT_729379 [Mycena epipterygia]|nr:hypothetical protein C8R44DRAFT_729379 [Mycena epipterygia]